MRFLKISFIFMSLWLASSVAFSNGVVAPELSILKQAKNTAEYPVLRRIQELTLELQLLEITIKNRRDTQTEEKISSAIKQIENDGAAIADRFKQIRKTQLEGLFGLFMTGKRYGDALGVLPAEWDEILDALREGDLVAGMITVHAKSGVPLNLVSLAPLYIGKQYVWNISLPEFDRKCFWVQARTRGYAIGFRRLGSTIGAKALEKRAETLNASFNDAEQATKKYFTESYVKVSAAFEPHRYAILQRVQMARKALEELEKTNTAMGAPEELSTLYNHVLDNLFSYGVDISLSGMHRDFEVKGILFAESPERSQELLKKLKYSPSHQSSYNPPST